MKLRRLMTLMAPVTIALAFHPVSANAEVGEVGFRGGLSIARLHGDDVGSGVKSLHSFAGGVSYAWSLNDMFAIRPELLYVTKGVSFGESQATDINGTPLGTIETLHTVNYIEVPVLLRAAMSSGT